MVVEARSTLCGLIELFSLCLMKIMFIERTTVATKEWQVKPIQK